MLDQLMHQYPDGLAILEACKNAAYNAMETEPGNSALAALHNHFKEAELAFLRAHEIMIRLQRQGQGKEL